MSSVHHRARLQTLRRLYGVDLVSRLENVRLLVVGAGGIGCELLKIRLDDLKPKLHVFGHIHDSYGIKYTSDTLSVNASICNERYQPINKPIVVEVSEVYGEKVITYVDNG